MDSELKRCSKCKVEKSRDEFGKNCRKKDKLDPQCKECKNAQARFVYNFEYKNEKKVCIICNNEKIIKDFEIDFKSEDGLKNICRKCVSNQKIQLKSFQALSKSSKICCICGSQKSITEFGKNLNNKDKLASACKICTRKRDRDNYQKNMLNDNYKKYCREKTKKHNIKAFNKDPNFYKKRYYKKHIENVLRHRDYYNRNKDLFRNYNAAYRCYKHRATIVKFTDEQLNQRMSVFGYKCAYCGGPFEHVDHVIPLSRGGPHCLANLRPSCAHCNLSKNNKKLSEWKPEIYS
jgi:hypothetical protein